MKLRMRTAVRMLLASALLCLCARGGVYAQQSQSQLPDAPAPAVQPVATPGRQQSVVVFHKKVFWTLVAVDAGSAIADAQTSWHNEQTYPNGSEQHSWLYGRKPTLERYYATFAVMDGGAVFLSYKLLRSRHKFLRLAGWAPLAGVLAAHTDGWVYNLSVW
jgi:hypothetical protein